MNSDDSLKVFSNKQVLDFVIFIGENSLLNRMWGFGLDSAGSGLCSVVDSFRLQWWIFGFVKGGEFRGQLFDCQFLKQNFLHGII
jgi:hypothetical protein